MQVSLSDKECHTYAFGAGAAHNIIVLSVYISIRKSATSFFAAYDALCEEGTATPVCKALDEIADISVRGDYLEIFFLPGIGPPGGFCLLFYL